jgi:hypothetical protein
MSNDREDATERTVRECDVICLIRQEAVVFSIFAVTNKQNFLPRDHRCFTCTVSTASNNDVLRCFAPRSSSIQNCHTLGRPFIRISRPEHSATTLDYKASNRLVEVAKDG